jgi:molecular chaperone GrpE
VSERADTPRTPRADVDAEAAASETDSGAAAPADDLEARIASLEAERDSYLDHLKRVAAEFENYRKRVARDQEAIVARANERLVVGLLPVLDDLERAVAAFDDHEADKVAEGVALVHHALKTLLAKEGIVEIAPLGEPFDPHLHEALLKQPADEPEGTVIDLVQKGFRLGERVIRPARVVVAAPRES